MLVLIAVGVVTDVARSKRISTRDPSLTVVPSPTDPLLVLLAYGTVQAFNPSLPPAIFVSQLSHVTVLHSQSKSRLHFSYVEYVTFRFLYQSILCSATGRRSLHSARTVSKESTHKKKRSEQWQTAW